MRLSAHLQPTLSKSVPLKGYLVRDSIKPQRTAKPSHRPVQLLAHINRCWLPMLHFNLILLCDSSIFLPICDSHLHALLHYIALQNACNM